MESLPYELVDMIGTNLLPKYRCRLYLCHKVWYDTCYLMQQTLFNWHQKNKLITNDIAKISYINVTYECKLTKNKQTNVSIYIVPHWNRRVFYGTVNNGSLRIYTQNNSISDEGGSITYMPNKLRARFRFGISMAEYWLSNMHTDTSMGKIIYDNIENITKYLDIHDVGRLWMSLGVYYYYLLKHTTFCYSHIRHHIRMYKYPHIRKTGCNYCKYRRIP
jgi:hypothetical protein